MMVEFSGDERAALIDLLVGVIERDLFPLSRRIQLLRSILAKIRPMPELAKDDTEEADGDPAVL
jgi:hypothetical protein